MYVCRKKGIKERDWERGAFVNYSIKTSHLADGDGVKAFCVSLLTYSPFQFLVLMKFLSILCLVSMRRNFNWLTILPLVASGHCNLIEKPLIDVCLFSFLACSIVFYFFLDFLWFLSVCHRVYSTWLESVQINHIDFSSTSQYHYNYLLTIFSSSFQLIGSNLIALFMCFISHRIILSSHRFLNICFIATQRDLYWKSSWLHFFVIVFVFFLNLLAAPNRIAIE